MDINTVITQFCDECNEDYVGLWVLIRLLEANGVSKADLVPQAECILKQLVTAEIVTAGDFDDGCFVRWEGTPSEVVSRVIDKWTILGRVPDIGEVAWFKSDRS